MRICIATGGSGGHIYPALALADYIKEMRGNCEFCFIGTQRRMEAVEIPKAGYPFYAISAEGYTGSVWNKLLNAFKLGAAYMESRKILRQFQPDLVIGFGNYISVPVLLAAHHMKIATMIHEQNSFAGKANRLLGKSVDKVVGCYPTNLEQFPPAKTRILGNPRATVASRFQKDPRWLADNGLQPHRPLVVVMMGSLGSTSVNEIMREALHRMDQQPYQVLYVTGTASYEAFVNQITVSPAIRIVPYTDGLNALAHADLAVCRAGATTAAELTAMGVPAILIPSPYVPNNHQVVNAQVLVEQGAALMIEEKDLTAAAISAAVTDLMNSLPRREAMRSRSRSLAMPSACADILAWMEEKRG